MGVNYGEIAQTPDHFNRINVLNGLVERGIDGPEVIGYHGTSVEAFQYYIENGSFAGYTGENYDLLRLPQKGDLYFYPFEGALPIHPNNEEFMSKQDALETIQRMADHLGRTHRFLHLINLPLDQVNRFSYVRSLFPWKRKYVPPVPSSPDYEGYMKLMSLRPKTEMEKAIIEASDARGVIVAINRSILQKGMPEYVNEDNDMRINMLNTSIENAFYGIKPVGDIEINFFNSLKI